MLLNGMFAFRKTIVQIKRNPDTSTESIADQQPSTYPQHLYKYVSLTTAVQISRLFDILMSHRLYFPRYTELNDPLEGAAIDIPVGGYAGSSIYKQEDEGILEVHDSAVFHPSFVPDGRCCSDFPDGIMRQSYEK